MSEIKVVGLSFRRVTDQLKTGDKVKIVPEPTNKFDPNALAVHTLEGNMLGYVGKKDPLRTKLIELVYRDMQPVELPVLIASYHSEGDDKLWEKVEVGDLVQLWIEPDKTMRADTLFKQITSFTGEEVLWSEFLHVCTDLEGNNLLGGSTYAKQFEREFDKEPIARNYAKKNGYDKQAVIDYWDSIGQVSMDYGTSIHRALEHYAKYHAIFGHEESLPRVPQLREVVEAFLEEADFKNCVAEPLITDIEMGMSGWIDLLRFEGDPADKVVYIEDYKTNSFKPGDYPTKWKKSLRTYSRQLNYYGTILENKGYTVKGLRIWLYHEGVWKLNASDFTPVDNYKKENV